MPRRSSRSGGAGGIEFGPGGRINRVKVVFFGRLTEIGVVALGIIGFRIYATGGPYFLAEPHPDALSAPIMIWNYRLSMNNAKIEGFVEEILRSRRLTRPRAACEGRGWPP